MKKYRMFWAVVWLLPLLLPVSAVAQSMNASISGTVLDPSGAAIPGAELTLTALATGTVTKTVSSQQGLYSFPNLQAGAYELKVTATGFREHVRKGISITLDASVRADIKLEIGAIKESVEVNANATQVNFDNGEQKHGIEPNTLNQLPLIVAGGPRSAASFVTLMPGVTTGAGKDPANARINGGMYDGGDEAVLDGVSLAEGAMSQSGMISAHADFQLSPDMVSEVKVLSSNYEPQYGSTTSGQIIATTKSGTTAFHGAAYDYVRNKILNACQYGSDCGPNRQNVPKNNQNDLGANFGGPIKIPGLWSGRVKTFFYVNYEGFRIRGGINRPTLSVPTMQERLGDFSDWVDPNTGNLIPVYDPATLQNNPAYDPTQPVSPSNPPYLRDQFMGCDGLTPNVICPTDARLQNSLASQWFKYLPPPNKPGVVNNYLVPTPVPNTLSSGQNNWLIKLDQFWGNNDHLALSIYYQYQPPQLYSQLPPQLATEDMQDPENSSVDRFNWDHTFNPNLLNHAAFGYLNRHEAYGSITAKYVNDLPKIAGVAAATYPPVIGFGDGFSGYGNPRGITSTNLTSRPAYVLNDLLTWVKGRHTLKFGGEYRAMGENNHEGQNTSGTFYFSPGETGLSVGPYPTGNSIASFLLEQVDFAQVDFRAVNTNYPRTKAYILHAGDTWKATPKLTVSYGVRWEYYTPSKDKYDRFSFFDPNGPNPAADGRLGRLAFAGTKWGPASFGREYPEVPWKKGFGPRIGLAYAIGANTVVRTGYGIFYSQAFFPGWRGGIGVDGGITGQAGFANSATAGSTESGLLAAFTLSGGFPQNFTPPPFIDSSYLNGQDVFYRPLNANRLPYSQQWNLTIEHQFPKDFFVSVGYVGNKGTRLLSAISPLNAVDPRYLSLGQALNDEFQSGDTVLDGVPAPYPGWADQLINAGTCPPSVAQALLPYPQYCSSLSGLNENEGNSTFNSLQAKLEKRFSGGTYLLTSYTFSKLISSTDSVQESQGANPGVRGVSPFQQWRNKGLSYSDVPHTLSVAFVYDLPMGRGRRFLNANRVADAILGGWSLSTTFRATSGMPLWFRVGTCNIPGPFQMGCFPALLPGANPWAQDKGHYNPALPLFNANAFEPVSDFNFYSGRGTRMTTLRGFGYRNQDVALTKDIRAGERVKVELRAEFFNVWNAHFFANPGSWSSMTFGNDISDPLTFGMWDGSVSDPRNGQVALRISF